LVPLVVDQAGTDAARRMIREDPDVMVWTLSGVEMLSALGRRGRQAIEPA
jgi:hypothetical protein